MIFERVAYATATIANGASLSNAVNLPVKGFLGCRLFGIVMPAAWTAANLTFQVSVDGGTTYVDMYDATGDEVEAVASTSRYIALLPDALAAVTKIKIRSGTAATPVNQGGNRTIGLVLRAI